MPRVVRRPPLMQRLKSWLNPWDRLLELWTEFDAYDWESLQSSYGAPIGITLNIVYMFCRTNADTFSYRREDDVFKNTSGSGSIASTISYLLWLVSWGIAIISIGNTYYCFTRKRHYRLFEKNIEIEPPTPNARRVRVDSSPNSTPLRVLSAFKGAFMDSPESRAHPDETQDVWELAVWDPSPMSLTLFATCSPVHLAVSYLSLPVRGGASYGGGGSPLVNAPSVNPTAVVMTVIATQILLFCQTHYLAKHFKQHAADSQLVSKEVLNEYNSKYVHPRLNVIKRDVAVQTADPRVGADASAESFTPVFNRQGFRTAPNPNYAVLTMTGRQDTSADTPVNRRTSSFGSTPTAPQFSTPPPRIRQPHFGELVDTATPDASARRAVSTGTSTVIGTGRDDTAVARGRTPLRHSSLHDLQDENYGLPNPAAVGMNGLVNWHKEQNRNLSPSKMGTPLKGQRGVRSSTYAASLGTPLRTPGRRRQV